MEPASHQRCFEWVLTEFNLVMATDGNQVQFMISRLLCNHSWLSQSMLHKTLKTGPIFKIRDQAASKTKGTNYFTAQTEKTWCQPVKLVTLEFAELIPSLKGTTQWKR